MRICIVDPSYDHVPASALEDTVRYRHLDSLASALSRREHEVAVILAFHEDRAERRNAVEYRCVRAPMRSLRRSSGGPLGIDLLLRANLRRVVDAVIDARPDAVHMNGLTLLQPLYELGLWCSKTDRPLTVSYHGGRPRRAPWLQGFQRRILRRCHGAFFPTPVHARPWIAAGLLHEQQVIMCSEVSSTFSPEDRRSAQARTGMNGHPVFVWNARLHPLKDPLTALRGFGLIRRGWPDARLYMIYLTSEMEPEIRHAISSDQALAGAVELRGRIAHEAVGDFLSSAHFLVQSSLNEVSSYSVLEAMSCGVIPVVSDIPSFRAMTDGGRCGILFPIGDHRRMAERVLQLDRGDLDRLSATVRDFFSGYLSYDRIAAIYEAGLPFRATSKSQIGRGHSAVIETGPRPHTCL